MGFYFIFSFLYSMLSSVLLLILGRIFVRHRQTIAYFKESHKSVKEEFVPEHGPTPTPFFGGVFGVIGSVFSDLFTPTSEIRQGEVNNTYLYLVLIGKILIVCGLLLALATVISLIIGLIALVGLGGSSRIDFNF